LAKCTIKIWGPDPAGTGTETHFLTIELTDAFIVKIQTKMPNMLDPNNAHLLYVFEEVYFTYREITLTHEIGATSATDSWDQMDL
jgi:type VI secretion system secreted protein Hcp